MAVDTGALYYLVDPFVQWENNNGKPIVGGHVEVFEAGTDTKVITVQDWDGTKNPFKIPLGSDGRAVILVDPGKRYDAYVYDSFNNLACSRLNIIPLSDGDITISGLTKVFHDSTLSGDGTAASPLSVKGGGGGLSTVITQWPVEGNGSEEDPVTINDLTLLATDDTMTAYNAEVEGKNSIVLGVNGDWFTSATSGFQTIQGMYEYATNNALISNYNVLNGKIAAETKTREQADASLSGLLNLKQDKLSDEQMNNVNNAITAHQSLEGYATENFVTDITNNKLDTTAFSTTSGTFLTAHQDLSEYAKKDEIPTTAGLMEESKLEYKNNQITGYNGSAFAGQGGGLTASVNGYEVDSLEIITDNHPEQYGDATNPLINGEELRIYKAYYADNADNANYADHANNADYANNAGFADNAGYANNADYASNADNAGTLDYHPASDFVMHTDFEYDGDVITGCNGSAFGGQGGDGDMKTSLLEYNSDDLITGYNGSAFAGQGGGLTGDNYNLLPGANIGFAYDDTNNTVTISAAQSALSTQQLSAISSVSGIRNTVNSYSGRWTNAANWTTANSATTTAVNNLVTATSATWNNKQDELEFGYNDGKIVSINSSALSAGSNYEGVYPIEVNNDTKQISARTKAVHMQTFAHDDTLTHTEENGVYTLGVANSTNTETLLWEGDLKYGDTAVNLTESISNFKRIRITTKTGTIEECDSDWTKANVPNTHVVLFALYDQGTNDIKFGTVALSVTNTSLNVDYNFIAQGSYHWKNVSDPETHIAKIEGISRKVNN